MWNSPIGARVLEGAERSLYLAALSQLTTHLEIVPEGGFFGVDEFDDCSRGQQIHLLHLVSRCLLDREVAAPARITPEMASAVQAVYHQLSDILDQELDVAHKGGQPVHELLRRAIEELHLPLSEADFPAAFAPSERCTELLLSRAVLPPLMRDKLDEVAMLDDSPGSRTIDQWADLVVPDPARGDAKRLLAELRALSASKPFIG